MRLAFWTWGDVNENTDQFQRLITSLLPSSPCISVRMKSSTYMSGFVEVLVGETSLDAP